MEDVTQPVPAEPKANNISSEDDADGGGWDDFAGPAEPTPVSAPSATPADMFQQPVQTQSNTTVPPVDFNAVFDSTPIVKPAAPAQSARPFQPINLFGDPMGGFGAAAPKSDVDDAFGELFGATTVAANAALPTQIQTTETQAISQIKPEVATAVAPVTQENDDGFDDFGDFGDFEGAGTTEPANQKTKTEEVADNDGFGDFGNFEKSQTVLCSSSAPEQPKTTMIDTGAK